MNKDQVLGEFYMLCGDMVLGNAEKEDIERITKNMYDLGLQDIMKKEFQHIEDVLKTGKVSNEIKKEIDIEPLSMSRNEVLQEFDKMCLQIIEGTTNDEYMKRVIVSMIDNGFTNIMNAKFKEIGRMSGSR